MDQEQSLQHLHPGRRLVLANKPRRHEELRPRLFLSKILRRQRPPMKIKVKLKLRTEDQTKIKLDEEFVMGGPHPLHARVLVSQGVFTKRT